jgi:hypothetical protein
MQVALHTTFAASRKEPLAEIVERIHAAILAAGFGEPFVQFIMSDSPMPGGVQVLSRVLKRFPQLERFVHDLPESPGGPERRVISNGERSAAAGEALDLATLAEIARGVPRSFPFGNISLQIRFPALGPEVAAPFPLQVLPGDGLKPAIMVSDSWWVNGRQRGVSALSVIEAEPSAKKLPPLPPGLAEVFAACGKTRKTDQIPLAAPPSPAAAAPAAILAVNRDYRARIAEIVDRAALPHDLPPTQEAYADARGALSGPRKPALVAAFSPLGYDCRGETGTFHLRRRTAENLTAELDLDVGTWSNAVTAFFHVHGMVEGLGFSATLPLPVTPQATVGAQYPIGGPEQWQRIVENLQALVVELDRTFVPAITGVSGPAPVWYRPEG